MVYVEPVEGLGFRAAVESPIALVAEGATREEAVSRLKALVEDRLSMRGVTWPAKFQGENGPLTRYAGDMEDDPIFEEWREAMAENRRAFDAAEGIE